MIVLEIEQVTPSASTRTVRLSCRAPGKTGTL